MFGWRTAQDMERTMEDPEARAEKTREVLGFDELPEGYHPASPSPCPSSWTWR